MICRIKEYITYRSATLDEIMRCIAADDMFNPLGIGETSGEGSFSERALKMLSQSRIIIDESERTLLGDFFQNLGEGNTESQQKLCDMYMRQFACAADESSEQTAVRRKLYCSLGILGSLFVTVIFI